MKTSNRVLELAIVYLMGLAQGLALVVFPAAANIFTSTEFHQLSSSEYGSLFLPMIAGAIATASLGGWLARRWGLKPVFLSGLVLNLAAMLALASSQQLIGSHDAAYGALLAAMTALGAGFGASVTVLNLYARGYFPARAETALTALHALLGTGTALAPLLLELFSAGGRWWLFPLAIAVLLGGLGLAALGTALAPAAPAPSAAIETAGARPAAAGLSSFVAAAVLYGVCESIFGNWGTIYLHESKGLSTGSAALALSLFWAAVTAGRILTALLAVRIGARAPYRAMPLLLLGTLLALPLVKGAGASLAAFALAGLACSAFLPLSIGLATRAFSERAELLSGGMMAAYLLGFGLAAYGIGPLRELGGVSLARIYPAAAVLAAALAALAARITPRPLPEA